MLCSEFFSQDPTSLSQRLTHRFVAFPGTSLLLTSAPTVTHALPSYLLTNMAAPFPAMFSLHPTSLYPETTCCVLHSPTSLPFPFEAPSGRCQSFDFLCFSFPYAFIMVITQESYLFLLNCQILESQTSLDFIHFAICSRKS